MSGYLLPINGIDLWIEEFGAQTDPGAVLVSGAASPSDWWDDEFCDALATAGYRVLRYDLRDTGQSTTRPLGHADYSGDDLVADLAGLIRTLDLQPAHVIGISLGGGLAQQLGIAHPELIASLTLLSTSPGGPGGGPDGNGLPPMSPALAASFTDEPALPDWSDREAVYQSVLRDEKLFAGTIPVDEARIRRITDRIFDRALDLSAGANHWSVGGASGTREQLADITAPTLVVHGTADPLFPLGHGEALAREIPDARLLPVPGLGHQFPPPETWELIVPAIVDHLDSSAHRPGSPRSTTDDRQDGS